MTFLVCEICTLLRWHRFTQAERDARTPPRFMKHEERKELLLNPLLLPEVSVEDTEVAAEMAPYLREFKPHWSHDTRPVGEAGSVLRFFPALEKVSLGTCSLSDVSFVEALPKLRVLQINSGVLEDLGPLARAASLRELSLCFAAPGAPLFTPALHWLDASPLGALTQLESLSIYPNAAVLRGLKFPVLKSAAFSGSDCMQWDCSHLPDMPELQLLKLDGVQCLKGIGRFPHVRDLTLGGPLRSFEGIGDLRELVCLEVNTMAGWPRDVTPLTALPELRYVSFGGEIPRNYWPLMQVPKLIELAVPQKVPAVQLDVAAVNAALPSWDVLFALPEPRPLPPLKFYTAEQVVGFDPGVVPKPKQEAGPDYLDHPRMFHLELLWMHRRVQDELRRCLGDAAMGKSTYSFVPGNHAFERRIKVSLETLEAAKRLPEVLEVVRGCFAWSPHEWLAGISVNLRLTLETMSEQQKKWLKMLQDDLDDDEDELQFERYKAAQQHIIETQFKLRTLKEEGGEPDAEEFEPPDLLRPDGSKGTKVTAGAPSPDPEDDEEEDNPDFKLKPFDEQEQNMDSGNDDGDENIATAPPPEPPENFLDDPYEHPLAGSYRFFATLTLDVFFNQGFNNATVEQLMGRKPDRHFAPPPET